MSQAAFNSSTLSRGCSLSGIVRCLLVGIGLALVSGATPPGPQKQAEVDYALKARYLCYFLLFTEWPESSFDSTAEPLILGVIGEDPFGKSLETAVGKHHFGNRPIVIQRYRTLFHLQDCHALFISASEHQNVEAILDRTANRPVLVISDMDGVADRGGVINLFESKRALQFEIQLGTALSIGLRIDPRLLRLARVRRAVPDRVRERQAR